MQESNEGFQNQLNDKDRVHNEEKDQMMQQKLEIVTRLEDQIQELMQKSLRAEMIEKDLQNVN